MLLLSGILLIAAACVAGALLWSIAIHALPLWCGILAGMAVGAAGGGLVTALIAGLAAATTTLVTGQLLLGYTRSPLLRIGVGLAFALPAAIAGYYAAWGLSVASGVEGATRVIIAVAGAMLTAIAAYRGALRPRGQPRPAAPDGA